MSAARDTNPQHEGHKAAYGGRESTSTRNPHSARASVSVAQLSKLTPEERIFAQWRAAFGSPVSDEAKAQFTIWTLGKQFSLSDIRLWHEHPKQSATADANVTQRNTIFLEFFFDGSPSEVTGHEAEFTEAFERMIEQQLQERRLAEFRQRLTARRRGGRRSGDAEADGEGGAYAGNEGGGGRSSDQDWKEYLKRPVPATELSIRSMREAGCMLRFLVCQTSLSISASELLGQIAFQEHFPIDGVQQEVPLSTKPLPRWIYGLVPCAGAITVLLLLAWWQAMKQMAYGGPTGIEGQGQLSL